MKLGLIVVGVLAVFGLLLGPGFYGAYLAFKASITLGIIALVVEPSPTVIGWIALLGRSDVCNKVAAWLHLPF